MDKKGQVVLEVLLIIPLLVLVGVGIVQVYTFCRDIIHLQRIVSETARDRSLEMNASSANSWILEQQTLRSISIQQELWSAPWIQDE